MSKKKNWWNNGSRIWVWVLIIVFTVSLIGSIYVSNYENKEACKRSKRNAEKNIEQDAELADHNTRLEVQNTKLDNIQKTVDGIDEKLDRALRR